MLLIELVVVAIGLSMDAFAVSLCRGLSMKKINCRDPLVIATFFGGFQAIMPLLGWLLGRQFERYIISIDHWLAFVLLTFIGGKMFLEAFRGEDNPTKYDDRLDIKKLIVLAVATSVDALAVGITFAFLQIPILPSITIIGFTTFILSLIGVILGSRFGMHYKGKAEAIGGFVLIFIGFKILLEHLNIL